MRRTLLLAVAVQIAVAAPAAAEPQPVCTLIAEASTGRKLVADGDCDRRVAPASTFKIAIALMGYDAGILTSVSEPELPFRHGYADWREAWKHPTDPSRWIRESVVWYSQQVTARLGMARFRDYVVAFDYGNADVSGNPGRENGLSEAWLSSSLRISPAEQVWFLRKLVAGTLPVSRQAVTHTATLIDRGTRPGGWRVHGKTGTAVPRDGDGALQWDRPFGWFVGWAEKGQRTVVFARLAREDGRTGDRRRRPAGPVTRDRLIAEYFDSPGAVPE